MAIDERLRELATAKNFATLTTLFADGGPQTQVMWVDADDEHVLINTEVHRQKFKNVERDPRVAVTVWALGDPYRYVEVRGRVVDTVRGPEALEHIHACSRRYRNEDYNEGNITSERVILKIAPERVNHRG